MTLDTFQKEAEELASYMKEKMTALLEKGVKADLDSEIMINIINRQFAKLGE